jgi:hypothetical protein
LLELRNERINLGKINTHDVPGALQVMSFEIVPASFAYHVYFNLEKTSLFVDYQSMIKHMDATTPQVEVHLVISMDGNFDPEKQSEYVFLLQSY